jgi:hypothetical protein
LSDDSKERWVWASMRPGRRVASPRSTTFAPRRDGEPRSHRLDLPALDDHDAVADRRVAATVEEARRLEGYDLRRGRRLGGEEKGQGGQGEHGDCTGNPVFLHGRWTSGEGSYRDLG